MIVWKIKVNGVTMISGTADELEDALALTTEFSYKYMSLFQKTFTIEVENKNEG